MVYFDYPSWKWLGDHFLGDNTNHDLEPYRNDNHWFDSNPPHPLRLVSGHKLQFNRNNCNYIGPNSLEQKVEVSSISQTHPLSIHSRPIDHWWRLQYYEFFWGKKGRSTKNWLWHLNFPLPMKYMHVKDVDTINRLFT